MQEFHEKRRFRRIVYSRLSLVILAVVAILLGRGVWNMYEKYRESALNRGEAERQVADLSAREKFLSGEIERLKTPDGIDAQIRQKFNVKKDGEEVVIIVEQDEDVQTSETTSRAASIWLWFKSFFTRD